MAMYPTVFSPPGELILYRNLKSGNSLALDETRDFWGKLLRNPFNDAIITTITVDFAEHYYSRKRCTSVGILCCDAFAVVFR